MKKYEVIVIGGGPGGYVAAIKAAHLGLKVALVEMHKLGGICLNYGCIPTKTLLKTAKLYKDILRASEFGIDITNPEDVTLNWDRIMKRKDEVVSKLVGGIELLIKHNKIDLLQGYGVIKDKHIVQVDNEEYSYDHLILATGSSANIPEISGLLEAYNKGFAIDSTGAIALKKRPDRLTILGGGVIGVEFATLFQSLGTQVTILQRSKKILNNLDQDVQDIMHREIRKLGVNIIGETSLLKVENNTVYYEKKGEESSITSDYVLVCLGRKPNLKGLEILNLEVGEKGVVTDQYLETNVKNVYAVGDMNGKYMLAHVASAEAIVACESIVGLKNTIDYNKIPSCIYSFPEIGVVGLTEKQAIDKGHDVETSMFPLTANGKAIAEGESIGFVKIVSDSTYGEIIGVHIVASHATDMIAEAVATMELEGTVHDLAKTVHPHPTLSEIVMEAAYGAVSRPIHSIK